MFKKSRLIVALGLVLALGVSGVAFGTATLNNPGLIAKVSGQTTPKFFKTKLTKTSLQLGVTNSDDWINGTQSNPASEYISSPKNVKIKLNKAPLCPVRFGNGTTRAAVQQQCPAKSIIGQGTAEVKSGPGQVVATPTVTVVNGPTLGELQLVTEDQDSLGPAAPTVPARVEKSNAGAAYGQALNVASAPETGAIMITKFEATLPKTSNVIYANCKSKFMKFLRKVTYKDGTSETVGKTQKCKRKPEPKHGGGGGGGGH